MVSRCYVSGQSAAKPRFRKPNSPDGSRLGLDGVGGTEDDTADLDSLETGPDHADDGAGSH